MFSTSPGREARTLLGGRSRGGPSTPLKTAGSLAVVWHVLGRDKAKVSLTLAWPISKLTGLPRDSAERLGSVRVRSLRTQQRAKSQCQKTPFGWATAIHIGSYELLDGDSFGTWRTTNYVL